MKIWKNILMLACAAAVGGSFTACQELDIPPKHIISNEKIFTPEGIAAYMAGMYSHLPMEDFNMGDRDNKHQGFYQWNPDGSTMVNTGEFTNNFSMSKGDAYINDKGYWAAGFKIIRQANVLIQDLPEYVGKLSGAEEWIAEAKFIRAFVYFALVKRYGGMPILREPQMLSDDGGASLKVPRNSHKESVDFILEDLDYAIANMSRAKVNGRANRYVAAAFKSRVALYAGSVARYGTKFDHFGSNGVQLTGIPADSANSYFKQAFDATLVVDEGGYALVTGTDKREAFYSVFDNGDKSTESIFIRQYSIGNFVHSWDLVMRPKRTGGQGGYMVPLDYVELFEGLPKDSTTGWLKTTDAAGDYIVYKGGHAEFWRNAEPRLKASIMIPGETYKGLELDMRSGLIVEKISDSIKITKRTPDDGETEIKWEHPKYFTVNGEVVAVQSLSEPQSGSPRTVVNRYGDTVAIAINGLDGPSTTGGFNDCNTGIYGVKWLNRKENVIIHQGIKPWIEIRYAEVLLNRAEAAVELAQNGESTVSGKDLATEAFDCINKVRDRAGATPLASPADIVDATPITNARRSGINSFVFSPNVGLRHVRVERYKELGGENKLYWDIRRWFTIHEQTYEMRYRMLAPYLFASTAVKDAATGIPKGSYIYDTRVCDSYGTKRKFDTKYYYEKIPDGERLTNHLLEQNALY